MKEKSLALFVIFILFCHRLVPLTSYAFMEDISNKGGLPQELTINGEVAISGGILEDNHGSIPLAESPSEVGLSKQTISQYGYDGLALGEHDGTPIPLVTENDQIPGPLSIEKGGKDEDGPDGSASLSDVKNILKGEVQVLPKLMITEVFVYGRDEWIEIFNADEVVFSGQVGVKINDTNQKEFSISLLPGETIIIANGANGLITSELSIQYGAKWSFTDDKQLYLSLHYGESQLDDFMVSEEQVKKYNYKGLKPRPSFEKIKKDADYTIEPTSLPRTKNTDGSSIANPGFVFDFISSPDSPINQPETELIITELFFDTENKKNNWIEITNISDLPFSGTIELSGISKTPFALDLELSAKKSVVLAQMEHLMFVNNDYFLINKALQINRNSGVNAVLKYEDKADSFIVHSDRTKKIKGKLSSFEKVFFSSQWITTETKLDRRRNVKAPYVANPGIYSVLDVFAGENLQDISIAISHESPSEDEPLAICEGFLGNSILKTTELFFGNGTYDPFIELNFIEDPSDYGYELIKLSGSLLSGEIVINLEEVDSWMYEKNRNLILSATEKRYHEGIDSIYDHNLFFKSHTGSVIWEGRDGQERQLLDIVDINHYQEGKSVYDASKNVGCIRNFELIDDFSPGFDKKFLTYFKIDTQPKIEYIHVGGGGGFSSCNCPSKEDFCPELKQLSGENQIKDLQVKEVIDVKKEKQDSDLSSKEANYLLKIQDIVYDPPGNDKDNEVISILLLEGADELDTAKLRLNVNGVNKKISGVLRKGELIDIKGNFAFPNSTKDGGNVQIQLTIDGKVLDTYYYNPNKAKPLKEEKEEVSLEGIKVFSILDGDTIRYRDEKGVLQSVRLLGVDAPESNTARFKKTECFGKESKEYLTKLLKGKNVQFRFEPGQQRDIYGRLLAYVYLGDVFVNEHLITEGYAKEYTYKSAYQYQSQFKQQEQESQKAKKGMWSSECFTGEENAELEKNYQDLVFKIKEIIYDPPGSDKDKEELIIKIFNSSLEKGIIDFSDFFGLYIFGGSGDNNYTNTDDFALDKDAKFFNLNAFGKYDINGQDIILQGDFKFPNAQKTCVAMMHKERILDIYCYDPKIKNNSQLDEPLASETTKLIAPPKISITKILPNPQGADSGKEKIGLLLQADYTESELVMDANLSFSINGKNKKKLSGVLIPGEETILSGNFSFPNSESCIYLYYQNILLDTFCYPKPKEGVFYTKSSFEMEKIPQEELAFLKNVKLVKLKDQFCLKYKNQYFNCINAKMKLSKEDREEQKLLINGMRGLENLLRKKYAPLFYQNDIHQYFMLIKEGRKEIGSGNLQYLDGEQYYARSNIDAIFQSKYEKKNLQAVYRGISKLFGSEVVNNYHNSYLVRLDQESNR